MPTTGLLILMLICMSGTALGQASCTNLVALHDFQDTELGLVRIYSIQTDKLNGSLFVSHMEVDTDGAPDAYHPENIGTTNICNALSVAPESGSCKLAVWKANCLADYFEAKKNNFDRGPHICFFALITNEGKPAIQGPSDPKPGFFVSTTALQNRGYDSASPLAQINANEIPYVVLPAGLARKIGNVHLGDVAIMYRKSTDLLSYGLVADVGPRDKLGEGSVALHKNLGNDPFALKSGIRRATRGISRRDVAYLIFPGSGVTLTEFTAHNIDVKGTELLSLFGGKEKLKDCAKQAADPPPEPRPGTQKKQ